jgi:hypothetical protein
MVFSAITTIFSSEVVRFVLVNAACFFYFKKSPYTQAGFELTAQNLQTAV